MFKKNEGDTELLQQQNENSGGLGCLVLRRYGDLRQIWRSKKDDNMFRWMSLNLCRCDCVLRYGFGFCGQSRHVLGEKHARALF
jgi:hypothetical protein